MRFASLCAVAIVALVAAPGCGRAPATELVVVVDSDLAIPAELDAVRVRVTRPDRTMADQSEPLARSSDLPLTLGIVADGPSLGPIDVVAEGLHAGTVIVSRSARVTLVRGEARVLTLHLVESCLGTSCPAAQTCTESGCAPIEVVTLPPWTGTPPRLGEDAGFVDAGPRDGGAMDGGPRDAAIPDVGVCSTDAQCDDAVACTTDRCSGGTCTHTGSDAACDDGERCTDDRCAATGCTHDPNTVPCDDGVFCNGIDVCAGGTCTHPGDPCAAPTTCDESAGHCVGCTSRAQCPADVMGTYGACNFADTCDQDGTMDRTDVTYTCASSACVATPTVVSAPCSRATDGQSCGMTSCDPFGTCSYGTSCATSGTMSQTCTDLTCSGGTCRAVPRTGTAPCSRTTDGNSCGMTSCDPWGACEWASPCAQSAVRHRTCHDPQCSGGGCGSGPSRMEADTTACVRSTEGTSCGPAMTCQGGACAPCVVTLSGGFTSMGAVKTITTSGSSWTVGDTGMPVVTGTITASSGVSFSGSVSSTIAVWQVMASGHTISFTDWGGTAAGTITVTGATVSGVHAPPCVPSMYGCFPPTITSITTSGNQLQLHTYNGMTGTITFTCE
ncbi:MAG: hypothetical protein U0234_31575 [Sandaracinus sp.]